MTGFNLELAQRCPRSFFAQDTKLVARALLGKLLVRHEGRRILAGRITETESYIGQNDAACHAARGRTERNAVMFGQAGVAYVYLIYGMYHCLNVVTEQAGFPAAVLVRSLEPVAGLETMRQRRSLPVDGTETKLLTGPGKLAQALAITKELNGCDLVTGKALGVYDDGTVVKEVVTGPRIGVDYAGADAQLPWRFGIKGSRFLSRPF